MTTDKLDRAITESLRFLTAARKAKERIRNEPEVVFGPCKEISATKRASMDLTRALAELRRK